MAFLMIVPPFTLGAFFWMGEIADETLIQRTVSPNRMQIAYVYFRGVGAYTGGNGHIFIRLRPGLFPFIERDIYYIGRSNADKSSSNYIQWRGNDQIYISETHEELSITGPQFEVPAVVALPYAIIESVIAMSNQFAITQKKTTPVRDVPIYPGEIFSDQSSLIDDDKTVFRSFNVREDIIKVEGWYENTLTLSPWKILQANKYIETEENQTYINYCIQATCVMGSEQRIYYWEFMGNSDSPDVHINIGTPNPITDACQRYIKSP
jgi:hypothetical protein